VKLKSKKKQAAKEKDKKIFPTGMSATERFG
jgi:hypothetical protein